MRIDSQKPFPELVEDKNGSADVIISAADIPREQYDWQQQGDYYVVTPDFFFLVVQGVARFLVTDGNRIVYEAEANAPTDAVHAYLLGSCCGALLFQRGIVPMHGSAVASPNGAIVFLGESGAGKSTLAAIFNARGYPLLSDDICAVTSEENTKIVLHPSYPQIKLCPDSADFLGVTRIGQSFFSGFEEKYRLRKQESFGRSALPLYKIFVLENTSQKHISIIALEGMKKFSLLMRHVYREEYINPMQIEQRVFQQCCRLSETIDMYVLFRPNQPHADIDLFPLLGKFY